MSWSHCGKDSTGRPIGYAHSAICDHPSCITKIDRGLSYACGGMHGKTEFGCEKYFCAEHLEFAVEDGDEIVSICEECMIELTASGDWALHPEDWTVQRITK